MRAHSDRDESRSRSTRAVRALRVLKLLLTVLVLSMTLWRAFAGGPL